MVVSIIIANIYKNKYYEYILSNSVLKYSSSFIEFINDIVSPADNRINIDVYQYIFLCELVNFFVILFGWRTVPVSIIH